ncbi:MAG: alanine--tRNA ligase [Planctomycetota bacterium]
MPKTAAEIRKTFLDFFKDRGHAIVPSAPVVPAEDPTLLFTNAGMNQFKDVFLGKGARPYTRAADTQKCIRVSGKHNDLDAVGHDTYHHTFFEMLGNWSFGDYFKEDAIAWAHELLVKVYGLPSERLWYTVYKNDDEAAAIWRKVAGVPESRVQRFGEKDNFWEMGETGPCGPCTEIHFDKGSGGCGKPDCGPNCCSRFMEIWNLVFIQFDRSKDGTLSPLPAKHVDTGMGLERLVAVLQGKNSNYDTDLFTPILRACEQATGKRYEGANEIPMRVVADHLRALSSAIADGIVPSNEGRGYVLRRLARRAAVYGRRLKNDEPFLHRLVPSVVEILGGPFPEIAKMQGALTQTIRREEEQFDRTVDRGLEIFEEMFCSSGAGAEKAFAGDLAFKLYDTFGFPVDLTAALCRERGAQLDEPGFERAMERQKEQSRRAAGGTEAGVGAAAVVADLPPTRFTGYTKIEQTCRVAGIAGPKGFGKPPKGSQAVVFLEESPFYAEGGGQAGDGGVLEIAGPTPARFEVLDVRKMDHRFAHFVRAAGEDPKAIAALSKGQDVRARVDAPRRAASAMNHTATHLLHHALRTRLGAHVQQAGSFVGPERLRFDFNHFEQVPRDALEKIEDIVNEMVLADIPVETRETTLKDALDSGALAFFGEKYGEQVRVVSIGGFSVELCGGTHVARTGEIGLFKVVSESAVSAGVRRIEAVSGVVSLQTIRAWERALSDIAQRVSTPKEQVAERVAQILEEMRDLKKAMEKARSQEMAASAGDLAASAEPLGTGAKFLGAILPSASADDLRTAADALTKSLGSSVVFLGSEKDGKVSLVCIATSDLVKTGFDAVALIRVAAKEVQGGGGGRPEMAQAGGKNPAGLAQAVEAARAFAKTKIGG